MALNAGVSARTSFDDADTSGFEKILATNLFGVINGIAALLPLVKAHASASSPAAVVITGSKQVNQNLHEEELRKVFLICF